MRVDQDSTMRVYSQPVQTKSATAVSAADKQIADVAASAERQPDVDRVELSKDAKSVSKMSDSERASLVKNLKDVLKF